MDYQKIKYFLKAAETMNFSEASRQMFITPQAFGRQISILEQEMGFLLFERHNKQIQLTPSGKICYENLSGLVAALEREYEKMCQMGCKRKHQIRVGMFQALSSKKIISPIVTSVLCGYPEHNINISLCDMRELIEQMRDGKLDICVTVTHKTEPAWKDYNVAVLAKTPARLVVSGYHPWVIREKVTVEDLKESLFVKMEHPGHGDKDYYVQVPCREEVIVPNYESMCLRLEQGDCFSFMSADMDSYCEKSGRILEIPDLNFDFELVIIYRRNNPDSTISDIVQFIQEEFEP